MRRHFSCGLFAVALASSVALCPSASAAPKGQDIGGLGGNQDIASLGGGSGAMSLEAGPPQVLQDGLTDPGGIYLDAATDIGFFADTGAGTLRRFPVANYAANEDVPGLTNPREVAGYKGQVVVLDGDTHIEALPLLPLPKPPKKPVPPLPDYDLPAELNAKVLDIGFTGKYLFFSYNANPVETPTDLPPYSAVGGVALSKDKTSWSPLLEMIKDTSAENLFPVLVAKSKQAAVYVANTSTSQCSPSPSATSDCLKHSRIIAASFGKKPVARQIGTASFQVSDVELTKTGRYLAGTFRVVETPAKKKTKTTPAVPAVYKYVTGIASITAAGGAVLAETPDPTTIGADRLGGVWYTDATEGKLYRIG